ncbi:uncharacterized protein RBU33_010065 isoform 1-T2 [Hipposideros larvatus]
MAPGPRSAGLYLAGLAPRRGGPASATARSAFWERSPRRRRTDVTAERGRRSLRGPLIPQEAGAEPRRRACGCRSREEIWDRPRTPTDPAVNGAEPRGADTGRSWVVYRGGAALGRTSPEELRQ